MFRFVREFSGCFRGILISKRALPGRHLGAVMPPIEDIPKDPLRFYTHQPGKSGVNSLLSFGRCPQDEALLADVRGGEFFLDAGAVGEDE